MKQFYVTTAIDYANGKPHLGHAYEKVLADVISRFQRMEGRTVHFLTGLDEHGQKVQQTADKEGVEALAYCDQMASKFQDLIKDLNISNDDYIRTTEPRHKKVVQQILQDLYDKGEIYKAEYTGFYSARAEQFLQEKDQVDGKWPEIYGEVVEITESNYFFKLSQYQDWLKDYIENNPEFIQPNVAANPVKRFLEDPINDLCISRPKERLSWGIELPFDTDFVTYVWFDALINYISAVGYGTDDFKKNWPADVHVIGKDIVIPAHGIYWPIMLHACGIELPKHLLVHGWWLMSGAKMSKSIGNIIDPLSLVEQFGLDPFRYYLIRESNGFGDSNFAYESFVMRYNNELGNDLGNLVSRLLNMGARYCEGKVPAASVTEDPEKELQSLWNETAEAVLPLYQSYQFHTALDKLFVFIRGINRYAELRQPWKLAKSEDPKDRAILETALMLMAESLRLSSLLISPVMPQVAERIHELLGISLPETWQGQLEWGSSLEGKTLGEKTILFPRLEDSLA
tara:strand:- start:6447 stop:7985 length:1539 start_codon:yes stop_codon:yes gene_type:complete